MTVQIGNVVLDEHLRLDGLEESRDILVSEYTSFDGTSDFLTMPASESRPLSLVATIEGNNLLGSFSLAQINAIKSIARAGQPTTLIHHRGTFNVLVLNVSEPVQWDEVVDPTDEALYAATVNMLEV